MNTIRETEHVRWYELLRMILTYATWRRPVEDREAVREIVERENPAYRQEIMAMAQTAAQVYMEEGRVQEARTNLRSILEVRFGTVPEPLVQEIHSIADLERLRAAVRQAAQVSALTDFRP